MIIFEISFYFNRLISGDNKKVILFKLDPKTSKGAKIDCLSFVMRPLLAQLIIGFFSCFAAAVYSTNVANKAGLKQSIFLDVYG